MQSVQDMVGSVVDHLGSVAGSGTVSGEPIQVGKVTLVVLSTVTIGMGAGGGEGQGTSVPPADKKKAKAAPGLGGGEGAGGGARVRPAAVIVFSESGVDVLTIPDQPGPFDKLVDRVPEVMEMVDKVRHSFE